MSKAIEFIVRALLVVITAIVGFSGGILLFAITAMVSRA
jgi:hypothetical protein